MFTLCEHCPVSFVSLMCTCQQIVGFGLCPPLKLRFEEKVEKLLGLSPDLLDPKIREMKASPMKYLGWETHWQDFSEEMETSALGLLYC